MLDLRTNHGGEKFCDQVSRRRVLEVGSLGAMSLGLPALLDAQHARASHRADSTFGHAKRVILLFMWGGPAHQDTWDLKPDGPSATRGEFQPIETKVPGLYISEHFPLIAQHADKLAIIRSVGQGDNNHLSAAHASLTGRRHAQENRSVAASDRDFPHYGAVLSKLSGSGKKLPTFVSLPEQIHTTDGTVTPGQSGGFLGRKYDPFQIADRPERPDFSISSLGLPPDVKAGRMSRRGSLMRQFDETARLLDASGAVGHWDAFRQRAFDLVTSPRTRQALDLGSVPEKDRWRYGWHTFGQSVLLARRLIETGVRLVTVYWHREDRRIDTTWDTHSRNFEELKNRLMPSVDRPIAALLEDLEASGLLDETLVIWNSEFGRTPRVNKNAGRDHWGPCNSVVMAGGGVPGGQVFGKTDRQAAYPIRDKVTQDDIAATVYHLLGVDHDQLIHDRLGRPTPLSLGRPITKLLTGGALPAAGPTVAARLECPPVGPFTQMLRQRSNRFLSLDCGYPESERQWRLSGWGAPKTVGDQRYRQLNDQTAEVKYLGVFYTHFNYGYLVFRLAEAQSLTGIRLSLRGREIPIPSELSRAADRICQIPFPEGVIRQIPYPSQEAFHLDIHAPGWKITGMALVGNRIEPWHLESV